MAKAIPALIAARIIFGVPAGFLVDTSVKPEKNKTILASEKITEKIKAIISKILQENLSQ